MSDNVSQLAEIASDRAHLLTGGRSISLNGWLFEAPRKTHDLMRLANMNAAISRIVGLATDCNGAR